MPKVSINILTKDRAELLKQALKSLLNQTYQDFEVIVVNDGSTDKTIEVVGEMALLGLNIYEIRHEKPIGITKSRQEALQESKGEYIAILDDDDEWVDKDKLALQVQYFENHPEAVLVGGGIKIELRSKKEELRFRVQTGKQIRKTMLFRNNFFTSTVCFKKDKALEAGGFIQEDEDLAEDYSLWLRLGNLGQMHNFLKIFTKYRLPNYNKEKRVKFFKKQSVLIKKYHQSYPYYLLAWLILKIRMLIN